MILSNYFKHHLDLHSKKNHAVGQNIARLHDIAQKSQSQQEILDQLHPWQAPSSLQFDQKISYALAALASSQLCIVVFFWPHWWTQIFFLSFAVLASCSYLYYESKQPLQDIIELLQNTVIRHKYHLEAYRLPLFLGENLQKVLFLSQLKQKFPIFNQGTASNHIPFYSSTIWQNEDGKSYHVLIFHYQFSHINSLQQSAAQFKLSSAKQNLWGIFIFDLDLPICTLACTTTDKTFPYPYHLSWQTSDIQTNQKISIYGQDQLQMVQSLNPIFTLKLHQFFAQREGDLLINPHHQMLCFLSPQPLMQIQSKYTVIADISSLRGHLRTLKLPHLERLKRDLLALIS